MTAYVVDASVVTEYLVMGHYTPNAVAFFQQMTGVEQLIVPEFCLLECTNVLWKHVRFQGMPVIQAESLLKDGQRPLPGARHRPGWISIVTPLFSAIGQTTAR